MECNSMENLGSLLGGAVWSLKFGGQPFDLFNQSRQDRLLALKGPVIYPYLGPNMEPYGAASVVGCCKGF